MAKTAEKMKPRKTEDCEWCDKRHYSEDAKLRCYKANAKECTCKRYWRARWLSHEASCQLAGTTRPELEPYTEQELRERRNRSLLSKQQMTRRKAAG